MPDCQNWYCGLAPLTPMERLQAETEAMYAAEDRRLWESRFEEATTERTNDDKKRIGSNPIHPARVGQ